jgi:hypothetical protein
LKNEFFNEEKESGKETALPYTEEYGNIIWHFGILVFSLAVNTDNR